MDRMIRSLLDTDLYKLTMQQAVFHQYPKAYVEYRLIIRSGEKLGWLADKVKEQIDLLADLFLTEREKEYLKTIRFLRSDYLDFLAGFRFNPRLVKVENKNGDLRISIKGLWVDTILFEVPILAIVSELYSTNRAEVFRVGWYNIGVEKLNVKIGKINQYHLPLADMGTRRRFSFEWQKEVVTRLAAECKPYFFGTSNVLLAMELGITAIGTQAHEWFMAHIGLVDNLAEVQKRALHVWLQEYTKGNLVDLGYALPDTFTTKAFLADFDIVLANGFSGLRHDSGDPFVFGRKAIDHYKLLGIDPRLKNLIFSDSLDIDKAVEIFLTFVGKIGVSFGIGTNLTNDVGIKPLNIVIKLFSCMGRLVVKISDVITKATGPKKLIDEIKLTYNLD